MTSPRGRADSPVALVTGGGSGIGRASALAFADRGYSVVVVGRRQGALDATVDELTQRGAAALAVRADVSDEADARSMVDQALERFGRLDAAANCAAVKPGEGILNQALADFDRAIAINLRGVWLSVRFEALAMRDRGGGSIVNVSSISAVVGGPADYAASKAGVEGLTRGAAEELAPSGIRVNVVRAGLFDTPMLHEAWQTGDDPATVLAPGAAAAMLRRIGDPMEAAHAVVWLCSPEASFVTGTCLDVDGGVLGRWL
ncbi:MAG: SDR family oxidoreductase [Acidobacteriota bacterium]|nr:SDR family oxidoreductase [Acidobacteriota bacterium]